MSVPPPRLLDAGETALVVEFGTVIDDAINARVLALDAALTDDPVAGVIECVPTYRSLMIHYDPLRLSRADLVTAVGQRLDRAAVVSSSQRLWIVPACYDAEFAVDLAHVATVTGLRPEQVVMQHATTRFRLAMYGFSPGWAYLTGLPPELIVPRRASPRDRIAAGSLIIAGMQAIVAARAMPSGWHILGRTPERLFAPEREPAFLVAVGDWITFESVDLATFTELDARAAAGEVLARATVMP